MSGKKLGGYALVVTGFLACPCHLVFILPLALALLGGTAVGAFLAENTGLVVALVTVYFVAALALGFQTLRRAKQDEEECASCVPETSPPARNYMEQERGTQPVGGSRR